VHAQHTHQHSPIHFTPSQPKEKNNIQTLT
jgi:hypothetical protein